MRLLLSLNTGIILLMILLLLLIAGALIMPSDEAFGLLYVMPLFNWLKEVPFQLSWWLILSIGVIIILALNTLLCSGDAIIKKYKRTSFLLLVAPQIMHIGFLLILFGHLLSSWGGYRELYIMREGGWLRLPDNSVVEIKDIIFRLDSSGYITEFGMEVLHHKEKTLRAHIIPNRPYIYKGTGIYIKTVYPYPEKAALVEISREPGAIPALIGAILFASGNIILLMKHRMKEKMEKGT
ncbi:MAG: hypothetical protein N2257_08330 [Thermodesulfovibrionales bacterium]|nr:hypothetical protein [Thermodesulfovibrionales bacterium]